MPSPWGILHNRTFECPSKHTILGNMGRVWNYLLSKKQTQKTHFDKAHGARELPELSLSQEVLFRSPANDEYIPGTIIDKATKPHSYIIEAQGKQFCRTREHIRPILLNIPVPKDLRLLPLSPLSISHSPVTSLSQTQP